MSSSTSPAGPGSEVTRDRSATWAGGGCLWPALALATTVVEEEPREAVRSLAGTVLRPRVVSEAPTLHAAVLAARLRHLLC